jgi:hypothetical protein
MPGHGQLCLYHFSHECHGLYLDHQSNDGRNNQRYLNNRYRKLVIELQRNSQDLRDGQRL